MSVDRHLYLDANSLSRHTAWAHGVVAAYALWAGLVAAALLVIGAWLWARRDSSLEGVVAAVLAGLSGVIAYVVNVGVSHLVQRTRPCQVIKHVTVILSCAHDFSFPSDHAVIAGALATGLLFFSRRIGVIALVLAALVAFARVYAGVHYPADVIAGLLLGSAVAIVVWLALRRPATLLARRLAGTPLRPLVAAHPAARL